MKKFFTIIALAFIFIPYCAVAAPLTLPNNTTQKVPDTSTEARPTYTGVQGTIEKYLCAPNDYSSLFIKTAHAQDSEYTEEETEDREIPNVLVKPNDPVVIIDGVSYQSGAGVITDKNSISTCVNKLYRFGLVVAGFGAVFMVALAGYFYMLGGEAGKSKGKELIVGSVAGILIILGTFIFLSQINPDLIRFKPIQPPELEGVTAIPSCEDFSSVGNICVLPTGSIAYSNGQGGGTGFGVVDESQTVVVSGIRVNKEIAGNIQKLMDQASKDGIGLSGSGWRSQEQQIALRKKNCGTSNYAIYDMPSSSCKPPTAQPGKSNHQGGRAIDFKCNGGRVTTSSTCFAWLRNNAGKYGLINFSKEPWHWSTNGK